MNRQQSAADLRQIQTGIEALQEGFALFDLNEELLYCNRSFQQRYRKIGAILQPGLDWTMFVHEANRRCGSSDLEQLDTHLQLEVAESLILESERAGNHWVRTGIHPMNDGGFVLTESDITSQRRAEEERSTAISLLQDILDGCASRIALIDADTGRILYRTPAWKRTFGTENEAAATFVEQLGYADLLTEILPTGSLDDLQLFMRDAQGAGFPARLSGRLIDYQGSNAIVLSAEDLSQLHQQRDQIATINQRLIDAIEALDQGFALFGADHQLLSFNRRFQQTARQSIDRLEVGMDNQALTEAARVAGHEPASVGWPNPNAADADADYEFTLGESRLYNASRRATSDGGFVLSWRDITRQRTIENELAAEREAAMQNEKLNALGQLLAGVAHELNNPLSVVVGHALMLREELDDQDALDSVDRISRSAERCVKIIKTFLAMAHQKPARFVPTSINDCVQLAIEITAYSLKDDVISVEHKLTDGLPEINADADQLAQLLVNLIINAEQAMDESCMQRRVLISTSHDKCARCVHLQVSDTGPGIPEHLRARIFEPFFTTKEVGQGTGMGLALCHRIVEDHAGEMTLTDSELGGASFLISVPQTSSSTTHLP